MNSNIARENIFGRLTKAGKGQGYIPDPEPWEPAPMELAPRIDRFVELMEAVRSEVYRVREDNWIERLKELLEQKKVETLTYGSHGPLGLPLEKAWGDDVNMGTQLVPWEGEIEDFKDRLFNLDAGITSTLGGIAEAAALIVWPTPEEPRLLSLVPPIHFAVIRSEDIFTSFPQAIRELEWSKRAPTNTLLISGPSKTADIELILQFGVHGPTDLIILLIE